MKRLITCLTIIAGCCVALASDIPPPREVPSRDARFAARGQVDLYVASTSALKLKPEDERLWLPAFQLGTKAVTLAEMKGDRKPHGGPTSAKDFSTYKSQRHPAFIRTNDAYSRPKENAKGDLICAYQVAVQAAEVKAEFALVGLVVSRGPVSVKTSILQSLILATGDVTAGNDINNSVIICDGDVVASHATTSLIIARGKIEVKGDAFASTLIAGGAVKVGKLPAIQERGLVIAPNDPMPQKTMKRFLSVMEMVRVDMKEKQTNPLGFITFFELSRIGLEVKVADGEVQVAKVEAGKPCEKAGFKVGDVIHEVNGRKPTDAESLRRLLRDNLAIGDATLRLKRGDKTETLTITLPE
ncbi:MAG: PDZ domain-containing protein [Planctomycetia bacterium]|nr:PDZ domain-containing protein [Planctomycetia bacterium]